MNNVKSNKNFSIAKLLMVIAVCFISILTFAGCNIFAKKQNADSNTSFDESGRLRIDSPYLEFNAYKVDSNGEYITDNTTGSFSWRHVRYFNTEDGKCSCSCKHKANEKCLCGSTTCEEILEADYDIVIDGIHYSFKVDYDSTTFAYSVSYKDIHDDDNDEDVDEYVNYDSQYLIIIQDLQKAQLSGKLKHVH